MAHPTIFYLPARHEAHSGAGLAIPEDLDVLEVLGDDGEPERTGLARALERIAAGEAQTLLVERLRDAASSLGELVRLLAWLEQARGTLVAQDLGFDSGAEGTRATVALLREVERWDREPHPARRPRGRPGLSSASPELAERVAALREQGLSLQAIAATLNAEGVPTPRGGAQWRASSVQAALGYRRPRPPAPGLPPSPPPRGPHPGGGTHTGPSGPSPDGPHPPRGPRHRRDDGAVGPEARRRRRDAQRRDAQRRDAQRRDRDQPAGSDSSSWITCSTALISARCVKACG
jgi:hypothetical protein